MKKLTFMTLFLLIGAGITSGMGMDNDDSTHQGGHPHSHTPQSRLSWIENKVEDGLNFVHEPSLNKMILSDRDQKTLDTAFQDIKIMYGVEEIPQPIKERIIKMAKFCGLNYWADVFEKNGQESTDYTQELPEEILSKILVQAYTQTPTSPHIGKKWNAASKYPDFQDFKLPKQVQMVNGLIDLSKGSEDTLSPFGDNVTDNALQLILEKFPDVQILIIESSHVSDLNPLTKTHNLQTLNLSGQKIIDFTPLSQMSTLQTLNLYNCPGLINLNPVAKLMNLHSISIVGCPHIVDISGLQPLTNLKGVTIDGSLKLWNIEPLSHIQNLSVASFISCPSLQNLRALSRLKQLHQVILEDCRGITDLSTLFEGEGHNSNITHLHLLGCTSIKDLFSLKKFTNLQLVEIWGCPEINQEIVDDLKLSIPDLNIIFDPSTYEKGQRVG